MIIDFHTHVFPPAFREDRSILFSGEPAFASIYDSAGARLAGTSDLIRSMDEEGVQWSVIFGFPWENPENYRRHNDYIVESVRRHPDRLKGLCCFSPLASGAAEEAGRCIESGLAGVGELAVYGSGLTPEVIESMNGVMEVCSGRNVPVMLHTNESVGHEYAGKAPMTLREIYSFLKTYPDNRIILAHWGGGIFFYALMKKEVRDVLRNVWFDTAASPFLYTPEIYRIAGEVIGFEKILLGTDYPLLGPERYFREIASSGIPSDAVEKIKGGNAASLLGLPV